MEVILWLCMYVSFIWNVVWVGLVGNIGERDRDSLGEKDNCVECLVGVGVCIRGVLCVCCVLSCV